MCELCGHIDVYAKSDRVDPTRSIALRNSFVRQMTLRFNKIIKKATEAIVEQNVFALQANVYTPASNAFNFPTSAEKVDAFMEWLRQLVAEELLDVGRMPQVGSAINKAWTDLYIMDSYKRGLARARMEMKKAGYSIPSIDATGGVQMSFNNPFHLDRVGVLYARAYNELKGITDMMDNQISKVLAQGMIEGDNPRTMARKMRAVIEGGGGDLGITDTLGRFVPAKRRAEMLARTEITRAYHQANIQEMKNWGIEGVSVNAEWSTAEDGRVCQQCKEMATDENGDVIVYTLDEIQNLIPLHPNCRCLALPTTADAVYAAKGPGIIQAIVDAIINAGQNGITKQEILQQLVEKFPDRNASQLQATINVQVPSRINKERFAVEKIAGNKYRQKLGAETTPIVEPAPIVEPIPEPLKPIAKTPTGEKVVEDWEFVNDFRDMYEKLEQYGISDVYETGSKSSLLRANRSVKTIADILNQFPQVHEMLTTATKLLQINITDVKNPYGYGPNTLGVYKYGLDDAEIEIGTLPMVRTTPTLKIGKGHNVGTDFDNTVRHEYAHHVYHKLLTMDQRLQFIEFYTKISNVPFGNRYSNYFAKKVSMYAGTQVGEAWAECFAAYTSPLYGTSSKYTLPKEIEDIMKQLVGERSSL